MLLVALVTYIIYDARDAYAPRNNVTSKWNRAQLYREPGTRNECLFTISLCFFFLFSLVHACRTCGISGVKGPTTWVRVRHTVRMSAQVCPETFPKIGRFTGWKHAYAACYILTRLNYIKYSRCSILSILVARWWSQSSRSGSYSETLHLVPSWIVHIIKNWEKVVLVSLV